MSRIVLAPLLAGVLLVPLAAPATAAGPLGATASVVTAGLAFGDFAYPLAEGKQFTIQRHVLDPGEIVRWKGAGTTVAIHQTRGKQLTNYPSCTTKQTWRTFPAYYVVRSAAEGTLTGVTVNTSDAQVELFTLVSEAIGKPQTSDQMHRHAPEQEGLGAEPGEAQGELVDPVSPAKGCPDGPAAETTVLAAGKAAADDAFELVDHNQIAVYRHSVPAGYNSGWHYPSSPTLVVPVSGELTSQHSCGDVTARKAGQVFVANGPLLVKNPGGQAAEYLSVVWNIPNGMVIDVPLYLPELPPTSCPATALPL